MTASIFGASGFTGSTILDLLLADSSFTEVKVFVRKPMNIKHAKLQEFIIDFDKIADYQVNIKSDVVFNCMGTTIKKAGSKAAQQTIDRDYPVAIAQVAALAGVGKILNVSSVGAEGNPSNFYLKTKTEMERGVATAMGKNAYFFRPSFIVGNRPEFRLAERGGIYLMKIFDLGLVAGLSKWHSMPVETLAQSMINVAKNGYKQPVLEYKEILESVLVETGLNLLIA